MSKPRLLDLFCGAGGAAVGYHRAGFEVVGVDIKPQPHYPFTFVQADALEYVAEHGREFDAIHASPPCQHYSSATRDPAGHPDLYAATRAAVLSAGRTFAIENVIGAPYDHGVVLCGSMFGLEADGEWLQRHRNFELSRFVFQPAHPHRTDRRPATITGNSFTREVREFGHSRQVPFPLAQRLMGIDWTTRDELGQAIPPAYTEWIGTQLIAALASPSEKPQDEPERPEWLRVTDRTFYRVRGRRIEISEPSCRHWRRVDTIPACAVRVKR